MLTYQESLIRSLENCDRDVAGATLKEALRHGVGLDARLSTVVPPATDGPLSNLARASWTVEKVEAP